MYVIYTPNMMGNWSVNFYWPGDSTYAAINRTDPFTVGEHIPKRTVWAYLSLRPYPVVGLGQDVLINAWVSPPPMVDGDVYDGYMFTFTSPTGNSFTVGPMESEQPGTVWFDLPLTELGNWSIKFEFPGDHASLPASITRYITVQDDWIPSYPDTPLPTSEWTFPINVENREWRNIAGPWYEQYYNSSAGAWNPYTEAPKTAHILWKISSSGQPGGFMGAPHSVQTGGGDVAYAPGDAGIFSSTVPTINTVMGGRGYYTSGGNIYCVDMRTGETLWTTPGSFNVGARRGRSGVLYSFGSRFIAYDAFTGAVILNVTGMSMDFWVDPYAISSSGSGSTHQLIKWDTSSTTNNFVSRVVWNISIPLLRSDLSTKVVTIQSNLFFYRGEEEDPSTPSHTQKEFIQAINLTTGATEYTWRPPYTITDPDTWMYSQGGDLGSGYGKVFFAGIYPENEGRGYAAIDASTGRLAWISEQADMPWGNFWAYMPRTSGYGMLFGLSYSGVWAFNVTNGKIVWHFIDQDVYNEEPYESNVVGSDAYPNNLNLSAGDSYATYSFGSVGPIVGGGIVFAPNTEHSPTFIYRGIQLHAIDAFTGEPVWSILGYYNPSAIAYGILVASDSYNGFTYAFGKGETETTVSPSSEVIAKGDSILLKGTVLDMSPAQKGTAAIVDASQTAWMEYLHMQQPNPTNATGVEVSLDTLDPNNNMVHIGTVTSDTAGNFKFGWTPEIEGAYTVIASFMGSEAYYSSEAETAVLVTPAPATSSQAEQPQVQAAPDYTWIIVGLGIAMILVVLIGIAVLYKKK